MTTGITCSTQGCNGLAPAGGRHAGKCSCCVRETWLADKPAIVRAIVASLTHSEPETVTRTLGPCCGDREAGG